MSRLEEETGHRAELVERLGEMLPTPGFCDERIHLFTARDLVPGEPRTEKDEVLSVVRMRLEEAIEGVRTGVIVDGKTIAALALVALGAR